MFTDVSALLVDGFFAGLFSWFFVSENEDRTFLRNFGGMLRNYTALHPRRCSLQVSKYNHRCEIIGSNMYLFFKHHFTLTNSLLLLRLYSDSNLTLGAGGVDRQPATVEVRENQHVPSRFDLSTHDSWHFISIPVCFVNRWIMNCVTRFLTSVIDLFQFVCWPPTLVGMK